MKTLKVLLWILAIINLLAFASSFLPLDALNLLTKPFDIEPMPDNNTLNYAYRVMMICAGAIGIFLIVMARDPKKYKKMIKLVGWTLILVAVYMFVLSFFVYEFENRWFYLDPLIYLVLGGAIVKLTKKHC